MSGQASLSAASQKSIPSSAGATINLSVPSRLWYTTEQDYIRDMQLATTSDKTPPRKRVRWRLPMSSRVMAGLTCAQVQTQQTASTFASGLLVSIYNVHNIQCIRFVRRVWTVELSSKSASPESEFWPEAGVGVSLSREISTLGPWLYI